MKADAINVIREAEKAAEMAEKKAKEEASELVSEAQKKAKEFVDSRVAAAKTESEASLKNRESLNEDYLKKAEAEIAEEVRKLRSDAETKKKVAVAEVNKMLFD